METGGRCPVCSTPVEETAGRCRSCGTLHHADCWRYNRGCGVYACSGRRRVGGGSGEPDPGELRDRLLATLAAAAVTLLLLVEPLAERLVAWL